MKVHGVTARALGLVLVLVIGGNAATLRFVDYNITASGGTVRPGLDTILQGIGNEVNGIGHAQPLDLLMMQEVQSQATVGQTVTNQLNAIYGAGTYARSNLNGTSAGSGTQGVVYNTHALQLIGETAIGISGSGPTFESRQPLRYEFRPIGGAPADDFFVYVSHYKAGTASSPDQAQRQVEALNIRADADALGSSARIIYAGDYNIQSSSETSFQTLIAPGNGMAKDPLNQLGSWHNNSSFLSILTQAPANSPPGGLTGGGLDDRFDFQMVSNDVLNADPELLTYIPGTYHTFGNNGSVPLNGDINGPTSTALPGLANRTTILNLLVSVSDHLPVVADFSINVPEPISIAPIVLVAMLLHRRSSHGL